MPEDYFQDLTQPSAEPRPKSAPVERVDAGTPPEKSIRNIQVNPSRPRSREAFDSMDGNARFAQPRERMATPRKRGRSFLLWGIACLAVVALVGAGILAFRNTTVTVTPRVTAISFTPGASITAVRTEGTDMTEGVLSYSTQTITVEDTATVKSSGTEHAEEKASGQITVYNAYAATPVKLLKNTRFETPQGLVFRAPAAVVVPGKTSRGPGSVTITVIADQVGEAYNVGPTAKFTLPGLKGSKEYEGVYASSAVAMTGGFSGDRASIAPADLQATESDLRTRLQKAMQEKVATLTNDSSFVVADVSRVEYSQGVQTPGEKGLVTIREKATLDVAVFPSHAFATATARAAGIDVGDAQTIFAANPDFLATPNGKTTATSSVLTLSIAGSGRIHWGVDGNALAAALAGKDKAAFQTIIKNFLGIDKATANVMPPWASKFPADASKITVRVAASE